MSLIRRNLILLCCLFLATPLFSQTLTPRNLQAPFPYLTSGERIWPILEGKSEPGTRVHLIARENDKILGEGEVLSLAACSISLTTAGELRVVGHPEGQPLSCQLEIQLTPPGGEMESQVVTVRPAPPDRPISYYADLVDDLINIFSHSTTGEFSPITRSGLDQYFRRLQAHGTRRLIVWLSPFPYIAEEGNYTPEEWLRYERQTRAILDHQPLTEAFTRENGLKSWEWLRVLMALRLDPEFGRMFGESARRHGISLTVSYRPFEAALTKYYEVPTFEQSGEYLWGFLPLASLTTNYRPDQVGWKHYREVLREIGQPEAAELDSIELSGVTDEKFNPADLRITLSPFPPIAEDSLVLVRDGEKKFRLERFEAVRKVVEERLTHVKAQAVEQTPAGLRLTGLRIPSETRYLILSWKGEGEGPLLSSLTPIRVFAKAGNQLGRETTYWVQPGRNDVSRIAAITEVGEFRSEFNSAQESQKLIAAGPERIPLSDRQIVIDLGEPATVEIMDFNQPLTRENAIRELQTILKTPGFDEILINTRSHVDLPLSMGDGPRGIQSAGSYWHSGPGLRNHLGLDKAYVPRSPSSLKLLKELAAQPGGLEKITTWQPDEWNGPAQSPSDPPFRYARNRGTADGLRLFYEDLEKNFPKTRIRAMTPQSGETVRREYDALDKLEQPNGGAYGRDYYHRLWPSNNHIQSVGEGIAMVDLTGLRVEPVSLGSGGYMEYGPPFELHVRESILDLQENRGSSYRGPHSYFMEGQYSLRWTTPEQQAEFRSIREKMLCHLLGQKDEINEVILYEATDWLYRFDLSDADLCGYFFLERCGGK